jgi:hypothetical protein
MSDNMDYPLPVPTPTDEEVHADADGANQIQFGCCRVPVDEVYPRQYPYLRTFDSWEEGSGKLDGSWITKRGTQRFTKVHIPSVEDRYVLLAI